MLSIYYCIGVNVQKVSFKYKTVKKKLLFFCIFILGFYIINNFVDINYMYSGAICGCGCIVYLSKMLEELKIKNFFIRLGKNSMDIVIWHLICFRVVILLQLIINNEPIKSIVKYYPTYDNSNLWGVLYIIIGAAGALLIGYILRNGFWSKFLKKCHIV